VFRAWAFTIVRISDVGGVTGFWLDPIADIPHYQR